MTFSCEICNKLYKSYQTLWNHNKIKHNDLIINIKQNKECKFSCNLCNKKFTRNDNLKYHKNNTCKLKTNHIIINNIDQPNNNNITNNNITNNTLNNINNGTINIYINKTGTENVLELNECEKNKIFDKELCSIFLFIKFINFNERLPNNHSFCSKSLEGKYVLSYNTEEEKIESVRKKYFYHELLNNSVEKMEILYKSCKHNFSKEKQMKVEDTIKTLKDIKTRDFSNKILKEVKNKLIEISYNCRHTVLNTWDNPNHNIKPNNIIDDNELLKEIQKYDTSCDTKYNSESELNTDSNSDSDTESEFISLFSKK